MKDKTNPALQQLMHRGMARSRTGYNKVLQRCANFHNVAVGELKSTHAEQYWNHLRGFSRRTEIYKSACA